MPRSTTGGEALGSETIFQLVADHGPWALLVFFLLWRDFQKDEATRAVLDKNAAVLTEIATVIRERMPRS
jgi:hypothetical protein